jgi:hypothetical protein
MPQGRNWKVVQAEHRLLRRTGTAQLLLLDRVAHPILEIKYDNTNNAAGTVHRQDLSRKHVCRFQDVPSRHSPMRKRKLLIIVYLLQQGRTF